MEIENATDGLAAAAIDSVSNVISVTNPRLAPPRRAADLLFAANDADKAPMLYWDRSHYESPARQLEALERSSTLYVGNLSFGARSRQVRAHFESIGPVVRVQMGLDRVKKTPCGFCFVEYQFRADALAAVSLLTNTKLDCKVIRVELDAGFQPGRQYGRGVSGGQVRDDKRKNLHRDDDRRNGKRSRDGDEPSNMVDVNAPLSAPRAGSHNYYGGDQGQGNGNEGEAGDAMDEDMEPASKRRRV
jgi:nuclear cap-binding protein subunit 2